MVYGSYNPGTRYRRRSQQRLTRFFVGFGFFIIIFGFGYWIGHIRSNQDSYILNADKKNLEQQNMSLQAELTKIRAEAQTANVRLEQVRASYDEMLAGGELQDLVLLLKKQLDEGVNPKRISEVILSARPPQNCSEPKSRRLLIVTPGYKGPESKISMESGLITLWGEGESVRNAKNDQEAWFDSTKPVKIMFQPRGSLVSTKEGTLPLYHTTIIDKREYRFTVAKDAQSFVRITYDSCDML